MTTAGAQRSRRARPRRPRQLGLDFRTWGGKRAGAGRKPKGEQAGVHHGVRRRFQGRFPLLVTLKVLPHVFHLRAKRCRRVVEGAIGSWAARDGVRIVHYAILGDHVHLIVEATSRAALARGMKGVKVRIARRLNRVMGRRGTVFADRYDDQVLETPRRVRNALAYVLNNARRHGLVDRRIRRDWVDPCSSARAFDGWTAPAWCETTGPPPVAPPGTWLLSRGWRRGGGRIATDFVPGR